MGRALRPPNHIYIYIYTPNEGRSIWRIYIYARMQRGVPSVKKRHRGNVCFSTVFDCKIEVGVTVFHDFGPRLKRLPAHRPYYFHLKLMANRCRCNGFHHFFHGRRAIRLEISTFPDSEIGVGVMVFFDIFQKRRRAPQNPNFYKCRSRQVCRYMRIQVYKYTRIQVYKYARMQV